MCIRAVCLGKTVSTYLHKSELGIANVRRTFLQSVESAADGADGVVLLAANDIAEEGVLVCDEWWLEFGLCLGEIGQAYWLLGSSVHVDVRGFKWRVQTAIEREM